MDTNNKTDIPAALTYWRVDEVIECLSFGEHRHEVEQALLTAMPEAYGGELPGEDDWPEPDASRDAPYKLSVVWGKLDTSIQGYVAEAAHKEFGWMDKEVK